MRRQLFIPLLLLALAAGCYRVAGPDYPATDKAKGFIMSQPTVTERTGAVKDLTELKAETGGRMMPFGWGDTSDEYHIFNVVGEKDSVLVQVSLRKQGKNDWQVVKWSILDANDAAQVKSVAPPVAP